MKFLKLTAAIIVGLALGASLYAQGGPQYLATHTTNLTVGVIPSILPISPTNLTVFSTAAGRRYLSLTFINAGTNPIALICTNLGAGSFASKGTNAVQNAGGIILNKLGTTGDRITYSYVVPKNGAAVGVGTIGFAAQGALTNGVGNASDTNGFLTIEGLGY